MAEVGRTVPVRGGSTKTSLRLINIMMRWKHVQLNKPYYANAGRVHTNTNNYSKLNK